MAHDLPLLDPVQFGSLDDLGGNGLQAGDIDHHVETEIFPGDDQHDGGNDPHLVAQNERHFDADG